MNRHDERRILVIGLLAMGVLFGFSHGCHYHERHRWTQSEDDSWCHDRHGDHHHGTHACNDSCGHW